MSRNQIEIEFCINWLAYKAGSIPIDKFYVVVNKMIASCDKPEQWLLEACWLPSDDAYALQKYVEDLELFEVPELILRDIMATYKAGKCSSQQLVYLLREHFLDQEYSGFCSSNVELDSIYERYQAPKLELSETELESEIVQFVGRHI